MPLSNRPARRAKVEPKTSFLFRREDEDEDGPGVDMEDIDLQALAEEVIALLKRELWLERERRGWHRQG